MMVRTARKRAATKRPVKKRLARRGQPTETLIVARVSRRSRRRTEAVGMRCRVVAIHQDAEVLVLREAAFGQQFGVPLTSLDRDGRLVADVAHLSDKDVWLSIRLL